MPRKSPNKKKLAEMKVLENMGNSPTAIARMTGIDHHTAIKYLKNDEIFNDPVIQTMVKQMTANEVSDLKIIGGKARACQHLYLDAVLNGQKQVNPIAVTAIADRSFQQRRLLEEKSAANVAPEKLVFTVVYHADNRQLTENTPDRHNDKVIDCKPLNKQEGEK